MSRPPLSLQAPLLRFVATSLVFGTAVLGLAACGDDDDGDEHDDEERGMGGQGAGTRGNAGGALEKARASLVADAHPA